MKKKTLLFAVFTMLAFSLYSQSEDPSSPSYLLNQVMTHLKAGNCEKAQTVYNAYLVIGEPKPDVKASIDQCIKEKNEAQKRPATPIYPNIPPEPKPGIDWMDNSFCRDGKNRFIAWNVVGAGYCPWNLVTGLEFRGGGIIGFGLYGDIGVDYTSITVEHNYYTEKYYDYTHKYSLRYAAGVKFYPYNGLFVDFGYGSITPASATVYYSGGIHGTSDEEAVRDKVSTSHGLLFHAGWNYVPDFSCGRKAFFGVSFGASYDPINEVFAPSVNLKLGVAWEWRK